MENTRGIDSGKVKAVEATGSVKHSKCPGSQEHYNLYFQSDKCVVMIDEEEELPLNVSRVPALVLETFSRRDTSFVEHHHKSDSSVTKRRIQISGKFDNNRNSCNAREVDGTSSLSPARYTDCFAEDKEVANNSVSRMREEQFGDKVAMSDPVAKARRRDIFTSRRSNFKLRGAVLRESKTGGLRVCKEGLEQAGEQRPTSTLVEPKAMHEREFFNRYSNTNPREYADISKCQAGDRKLIALEKSSLRESASGAKGSDVNTSKSRSLRTNTTVVDLRDVSDLTKSSSTEVFETDDIRNIFLDDFTRDVEKGLNEAFCQLYDLCERRSQRRQMRANLRRKYAILKDGFLDIVRLTLVIGGTFMFMYLLIHSSTIRFLEAFGLFYAIILSAIIIRVIYRFYKSSQVFGKSNKE